MEVDVKIFLTTALLVGAKDTVPEEAATAPIAAGDRTSNPPAACCVACKSADAPIVAGLTCGVPKDSQAEVSLFQRLSPISSLHIL